MRPAAGWLVAAAACLVGFVGLALSVTQRTPPAAFDIAVQEAIIDHRIDHRSPALTAAFQAFTTVGTLPVVVGAALTGVLILARRTRSWVAPTVLAAGVSLSALTVALVKIGVARPRPGPDDRIGPAALDFAFPSGHTDNGTSAFLLVTSLVGPMLPGTARRSVALTCAAVLGAGIGLSRVYLGYHWPSDVLGGWLLAATVTCAAIFTFLAVRTRSRQAVRPGAAVASGVGQRR